MTPTRILKIKHTVVKTALSRSGLPDIDYALNPYMGCIHGCIYCYARLYTRDKEATSNWGSVVVVKLNIASVLERETRKYKPGVVGVGTITDAYQPIEAKYKLTRRCIEILLSRRFKVSIQTKNPLVLRDLDILSSHRENVDVGFTITTLREDVRRMIEPYAPPSKARISAIERLSSSGIKTWIFYGPIIPGLNDDEETVKDLITLALKTNSLFYYDPIHVKDFMKTPDHPLWRYIVNKPRDWRSRVIKSIEILCSEYGVKCRPGFTGDSII